MKKRLLMIVAIFSLSLSFIPAQAASPMRVVTTLSTFADLVKTIGGDNVKVSSIASPRFNPHFIEPKPSDILRLKRADLFVHAGLDLELWRFPLVDAAGNVEARPGGSRELDLSRGVRLLDVPDRQPTRAQGDMHIYGNPHYWLDPENVKVMAKSIAEKLSEIDPDHAPAYEEHLAAFLQQLDQRITQWQQDTDSIQRREVVAYHNQWPYLVRFTGVQIKRFLEPKPGIPPTPKQLAVLQKYMKDKQIGVIVQSSYFSTRASKSLAKRTGAQVVLLCQNVGEVPACSDYLALLEHNVHQLTKALGQ